MWSRRLLLNLLFFQGQAWANIPNNPILQAVLEGNMPGQVIKIGEAKLIFANRSFVFLTGVLTSAELLDISNILKPRSDLRLVCDEQYHNFLIQQGFGLCPRVDFSLPANYQLQLPVLPIGTNIRPISDSVTLAKCDWYSKVLGWNGSEANFFQKSFGFVLLNDEGVVLAESYGAFIGGGACEIGIATNPNYRKQGYATIAAKYVIHECKKRGLEPKWSCDVANIGSLKTALRIGFNVDRYYAFITVI